jgi:hypothetical protein
VSVSDEHTDEDFEFWVIRTRLAQGLPPHVEDMKTLRQIAELLGLRQGTQPTSQDDPKSGGRR